MRAWIQLFRRWLAPSWLAFGMVLALLASPGCEQARKAKYERQIRQRFTELSRAVLAGNYEACVQYTDPGFVRAKGTEGTKTLYRVLAGLVRLANLTAEDIRIDSITFFEGLQAAQIHTSHRLKGEWKPQKPYKWVRVQNQWYQSFDP